MKRILGISAVILLLLTGVAFASSNLSVPPQTVYNSSDCEIEWIEHLDNSQNSWHVTQWIQINSVCLMVTRGCHVGGAYGRCERWTSLQQQCYFNTPSGGGLSQIFTVIMHCVESF